MIKPEFPESRLIQVGPGVMLRKKYQRFIDRNGIPDVIFAGYSTYNDLPRYYKSADIACFPSHRAGKPGHRLLEAMSVGKPVIASNIGRLQQRLDGRRRRHCRTAPSPEDLAKALTRLA